MQLKIKCNDEILTYESDKETVTIGRSRENDFVVPYDDFSRKHCQVTFKGEYAFIMDLGSKNGVTIDGKKIPPHVQLPIYASSRILLANLFEFTLPDGTFIKEDLLGEIILEEPIKRGR